MSRNNEHRQDAVDLTIKNICRLTQAHVIVARLALSLLTKACIEHLGMAVSRFGILLAQLTTLRLASLNCNHDPR